MGDDRAAISPHGAATGPLGWWRDGAHDGWQGPDCIHRRIVGGHGRSHGGRGRGGSAPDSRAAPEDRRGAATPVRAGRQCDTPARSSSPAETDAATAAEANATTAAEANPTTAAGENRRHPAPGAFLRRLATAATAAAERERQSQSDVDAARAGRQGEQLS